MKEKKTKSLNNLLVQNIKRLGHGYEFINYFKTKNKISRPILRKEAGYYGYKK